MATTTSIDDRLEHLGRITRDHEPITLQTDVNEMSVSCTIVAMDTLACEFHEIHVATHDCPTVTREQTLAIAEAIVDRVTYLLEPLAVIEVDSAGWVQVRSARPSLNDATTYYEVLVALDGCSLSRYSKTSTAARHRIPAQVTREVFTRLIDDFTAAVADIHDKRR